MVKNGQMHLDSLRDGREVHIDGQRVQDHVEHPAFRQAIRSAAGLYDYQARPGNIERMTFRSPTSGDQVSRMWQLPTSHAELVERRKALEAWAEQTCGFLGRSPDHVASCIGGMVMGLDVFERYDPRRAKALQGYYEYARDNDLYLTYVIVNPQADRGKDAGQQADGLIASVVDEDAQGITIKGAKMLGTASPMSNEVFVGAMQPLKPGEESMSFSACIPLNAKGVKCFSRKSFEAASTSTFDSPLASRFDENDAIIYFDEVKVPWERVFVHNNVQMAQAQWHVAPTHLYQNYQCQIRFTVKSRFLLGLARKIAEVNGVIKFPQVQEALGQIAAEVAMVEGLLHGMEVAGTHHGRYYVPNRQMLYSAMVITQQLYPRLMTQIRELAGGGMIMLPSSFRDLLSPEIAPYIEKTQKSPVTDHVGRVKLFKLAWDAVGSEFGSRHLQYEMFYGGANIVTRGYAYRSYDWDRALGQVDGFLSGYDLGQAAA
ncbi:4-hydroxyphenylacetate 3-monooxygenase oxygenase component [Delftia tsuruhatensis]|uniref:4-hydroxyphenylacetate 3-hydroxylase family protein n=1 Tax=Delftia tsuruhatensis TaxID=180282 RepID=UPI001E74EE4A|nr:4-hydroxyphenylacetate 3-hydroxylase N-terminal domain-containing protein [Delftia tsuruhatensis]CAB5695072.1 4-hydroxyphenylacetate 3-monooxygenase oxygenase component [Delftia tsuruhatensis]CAC9687014.1 4-hydroxyphenylacetate 3-monooxygenase oxygenase component [Delftia tsuruhatensis]